jgi:histidine ammonia-lyase
MGTIAARKAAEILENVEHVVAIEYFAACQALDFAPSVEPGGGTRVAYDALRAVVPFVDEDRVMHVDFQVARELLRSEDLLEKIEEASGALARS